ncbi:uncharacterized protein [Haliotis asinina]|uniref:uncharacterized protein n=1 Tax=Haliotis asinina TaxID=109174 RepID=UPI0035323057
MEKGNSLNDHLQKISTWANTWQVKFNPENTETIQFSRKRIANPRPSLFMQGIPINEVDEHKHLVTLRRGCSDLNYHKFERHLSNDPSCSCGAPREDTQHYLLVCPNYTVLRNDAEIYKHGYSLKTILYGNSDLSYLDNLAILKSVYLFVIDSRRFDTKCG